MLIERTFKCFDQELKEKKDDWWYPLPQIQERLGDIFLNCVKHNYKNSIHLLYDDLKQFSFPDFQKLVDEAKPDIEWNHINKDSFLSVEYMKVMKFGDENKRE